MCMYEESADKNNINRIATHPLFKRFCIGNFYKLLRKRKIQLFKNI